MEGGEESSSRKGVCPSLLPREHSRTWRRALLSCQFSSPILLLIPFSERLSFSTFRINIDFSVDCASLLTFPIFESSSLFRIFSHREKYLQDDRTDGQAARRRRYSRESEFWPTSCKGENEGKLRRMEQVGSASREEIESEGVRLRLNDKKLKQDDRMS